MHLRDTSSHSSSSVNTAPSASRIICTRLPRTSSGLPDDAKNRCIARTGSTAAGCALRLRSPVSHSSRTTDCHTATASTTSLAIAGLPLGLACFTHSASVAACAAAVTAAAACLACAVMRSAICAASAGTGIPIIKPNASSALPAPSASSSSCIAGTNNTAVRSGGAKARTLASLPSPSTPAGTAAGATAQRTIHGSSTSGVAASSKIACHSSSPPSNRGSAATLVCCDCDTLCSHTALASASNSALPASSALCTAAGSVSGAASCNSRSRSSNSQSRRNIAPSAVPASQPNCNACSSNSRNSLASSASSKARARTSRPGRGLRLPLAAASAIGTARLATKAAATVSRAGTRPASSTCRSCSSSSSAGCIHSRITVCIHSGCAMLPSQKSVKLCIRIGRRLGRWLGRIGLALALALLWQVASCTRLQPRLALVAPL